MDEPLPRNTNVLKIVKSVIIYSNGKLLSQLSSVSETEKPQASLSLGIQSVQYGI